MVFSHTKPHGVPPTKHAKAESSRSFTMAGLGYLAMAFLILVLGVLAASL